MLFRRDEHKELGLQFNEEFHRKLDPVPWAGFREPPDSRVGPVLLVLDQAKAYRDVLIALPGDSYVSLAVLLHEICEHPGEFALELIRRGLPDIEYTPFCRRPDIGEMLILDGRIGDTPGLDMFEDTTALETRRFTCLPRNA